VSVDGEIVGAIESGLLILLGVHHDDTAVDAEVMGAKLAGLRIFPDEEQRMNRSVVDHRGSALVVSQFTLYGDTRKGRRPSFTTAAQPELAEPLVTRVGEELSSHGVPVAAGRFGAMMQVELINEGPVTLVVDVVDGRVR
jgi:D-tyrosyl-tRNA(Tyr) deacylase